MQARACAAPGAVAAVPSSVRLRADVAPCAARPAHLRGTKV